jgi:hypothetical protein
VVSGGSGSFSISGTRTFPVSRFKSAY